MASHLRVFAQSGSAQIDIDAWNAQAVRFFSTRLGLAGADGDPAIRPQGPPGGAARPLAAQAPLLQGTARATPAARLIVTPAGAAPGVRSAYARPREPADLARAEQAELRSGTSGLAGLARRCSAVWIIDREGPSDALALRLAAIVASVVLGPILDPEADVLFGVKTARERLAALG